MVVPVATHSSSRTALRPAVLRLDVSIAAATGDRFVLRRAATSGPAVLGGVVLDPLPARGVSRRRQTPERVAALAAAAQAGDVAAVRAARVELHGIVTSERAVAPDVREAASAAALEAVRAYHAARPEDPGPALAAIRSAAARALRRQATVSAADAAARAAVLVDELVSGGLLVRDGDRVRAPDHQAAAADPEVAAAMERLVAALAVPAPPPLRDAAAAAGCPPAAIRELERSGRIVVLEEDLGYAMPTYRDLAAKALALAAPRTPHARGVPRRDRHQPPLRPGDPRGSRSAWHPPAHAGRPRAGSAGTGGRPRRNVTAAALPSVSGIVLAGGRSARFGRDKLAESIDGRPLLHHAAEAVATVATDVIIVAPPDVVPPLPDGVRLVHDEAAFEGPLAGCMTGLIAAREPLVVVAGGDMPSLDPAVLALLIRALVASSADAALLEHRGRRQQLPFADADRGRDRRGAAPARPGGTAARGTHGPPDRAGPCRGGVAPARSGRAHAARRRRARGPAGLRRLATGPGHTKTSAGGGAEVCVCGSEEGAGRISSGTGSRRGRGAWVSRRRPAWLGSSGRGEPRLPSRGYPASRTGASERACCPRRAEELLGHQ